MPSFDQSVISSQLQSLLYDSDPSDVSTLATRFTNMTDNSTSSMAETSILQTQSLIGKMKSYNAITALVGQMNEAYNANRFIGSSLVKEETRLSKLNDALRKELYKQQQQYLLTNFHRQHYRRMAGLALLTAVAVSLISTVCAAYFQGAVVAPVAAIAVIVIAVFYLLIMTVAVSSGARRRNYHWQKFYWDVEKDQKVSSCPAPPRELSNELKQDARDMRQRFSDADGLTDVEKESFKIFLKRLITGYPPWVVNSPTQRMQEKLRNTNSDLYTDYDDLVTKIRDFHKDGGSSEGSGEGSSTGDGQQ